LIVAEDIGYTLREFECPDFIAIKTLHGADGKYPQETLFILCQSLDGSGLNAIPEIKELDMAITDLRKG